MNFISDLKNNMDDYTKKKIIFFGAIALSVVLLIIIISVIVAVITKKDPYDKVEHTMERAAYDYFQDNKELLPSENNNETTVNVDTLVEQEYMKKLYKYTKNKTCTGEVKVTYKDNNYSYQGYLNCDDFKTTLLADQVKNDNPIVTSGEGLYDESGLLRFRGEYVNNYIKFGNINYRILKIDNENKIYLTPQDMDDNDETTYVYWDDRYNTEEDSSCGINDYSLSRIRRSLNTVYDNLDETLKQNLTTFSTCTAKRLELNADNTGNVECTTKLDNVSISLLPIYEYIKASLAPSCQMPASKECKNYNYLVIDEAGWWTLTGDSSNTSKIYYVSSTGEIDKDKGYNRKLSRYIVALKPGTLLKQGNGTEKNPYIIR